MFLIYPPVAFCIVVTHLQAAEVNHCPVNSVEIVV